MRKAEDDPKAKGRMIADAVDLTALEEFGKSVFLQSLEDEAQASGRNFLVEVNVPRNDDLFNQVNDRAVDYIRQHGAELVTQLDEATRNEIANTIADGLESKSSLEDIIGSLTDAYSFSEKRASLIAETEIANANNMGVLSGMYELRETGVRIKKKWLPDAEACDICLENGDAGYIDLDDVFPSGDDAPLAHPNCRCDLESEIEE